MYQLKVGPIYEKSFSSEFCKHAERKGKGLLVDSI